MNTVQDYVDRYTTIGKNLGLSGESLRALSQMLGYASYISEVEHVSYTAESSLERSSLMNSKIQHCVDNMYSVFRGLCPRVILKIKPTKYLTLNPYDPIIESQNFRVHYLAYYKVTDQEGNIVRGGASEQGTEDKDQGTDEELGNDVINIIPSSQVVDISCGSPDAVVEDNSKKYAFTNEALRHATIDELTLDYRFTGSWEYSSATFYPVLDEDDPETEDVDETVDGVQVILGFIAPKRKDQSDLIIDKTITTKNTYYVDCLANDLSDDMYIKVGAVDSDMTFQSKTRLFAEHILEHKIFDLTLPSFGSRLYLANFYKDIIGRDSNEVEGIPENSRIYAQYYGYTELDSYNASELKKIQLKGTELLPFNDVIDSEGVVHNNPFLISQGASQYDGAEGVCYIDAVPRDDLNTIHYKANRDRYVNSILRSNTDIGVVLEESFPDVIKTGGTVYVFNANTASTRYSTINLYYIPKQETVLLTSEQIEKFRTEKRAYYVITSTINVDPGHKFVATFNINLDLFNNSSEDWGQTVGEEILVSSYEKKFGVRFDKSTLKDIEGTIAKISNVKKVVDLSVSYSDAGREVDQAYIDEKYKDNAYFEIKYSITTSVTSKS